MPRLRQRTLALAVAALLAAPAAGAQIIIEEPPVDEGASREAAAYLALTITPVGALAPAHDFLLHRAGEAPPGLRLHGRFATIDRGPGLSQRTLAATLDLPVGGASLALTAAYIDVACDDELAGGEFDLSCDGGIALDARLGRALAARALDATGSARLVLGLEGTAGFSDLDLAEFQLFGTRLDIGAQALSATVGLPVGLVVRSGTTTLAPFVTPRIGWGRVELSTGGGDDTTESGVRPMLGAGLAVRVGPRFGLDLGLQRVFAEDAETTFGLGASVGF